MISASQPPRLLGPSPLTGRYYIATRYTDHGDGRIETHVKWDVTDEVKALLAAAWDEGHKQGGPMRDVNYDAPDAPTRNPYRTEENHGSD